MPTTVKLDDLLAAHDWVSAAESAALMDCNAFVSQATGEVIWVGEGVDEGVDDEPPGDIDDGQLYVAVPDKFALDLGRPLVMRFVREHLPAQVAKVNQIFSHRGAYSHFKTGLEHAGQLQAWYAYEQAAAASALRDGCAAKGFIAEL